MYIRPPVSKSKLHKRDSSLRGSLLEWIKARGQNSAPFYRRKWQSKEVSQCRQRKVPRCILNIENDRAQTAKWKDIRTKGSKEFHIEKIILNLTLELPFEKSRFHFEHLSNILFFNVRNLEMIIVYAFWEKLIYRIKVIEEIRYILPKIKRFSDVPVLNILYNTQIRVYYRAYNYLLRIYSSSHDVQMNAQSMQLHQSVAT